MESTDAQATPTPIAHVWPATCSPGVDGRHSGDQITYLMERYETNPSGRWPSKLRLSPVLELTQLGPTNQSGDDDGIDLIFRKTVSLRQRPRNSLGPSSGHPPTVGDGLDSLPENHTS